jgi:hypothetical protein
MSKWIVGVAMIDPKDPKKLTVVKSDNSAIELANTKKGGVDIYTEQFPRSTRLSTILC